MDLVLKFTVLCYIRAQQFLIVIDRHSIEPIYNYTIQSVVNDKKTFLKEGSHGSDMKPDSELTYNQLLPTEIPISTNSI